MVLSREDDDDHGDGAYTLVKLKRGAPRPTSGRTRGSMDAAVGIKVKGEPPAQDVPLDKQGLETRYPLHAAAVEGNTARVRSLLGLGPTTKGIRLNADDEDDMGRTALHYAAQLGNLEVCEELLNHMPDIMPVKAKGLYGSTALHMASAAGQLEAVRFLLRREADVMLKNTNGMTALHVAAGLGDLEICRALLEARAPTNIRSNDGKTPLLVAVQNGHRDVAGLLINYGSDAKAVTVHGENALHLAAAALNTHPDTVKWLIEGGCDVDRMRFDDKRPLSLVCETIVDAAMLDFEAQEPYWVPEEVFLPSRPLSDEAISVRANTGAANAPLVGALNIDVEAIRRKFGISDDDMAKARSAMGSR